MAIIKSERFDPPAAKERQEKAQAKVATELRPVPPKKQSIGFSTDTGAGFVAKSAKAAAASKAKANTLRSYAGLAAASLHCGMPPDQLADLAAEISVETFDHMGWSLEDDPEMAQRALPSICRAVSEALGSQSMRLAEKHEGDTKKIENEIGRFARAMVKNMAAISKNSVLARYGVKSFPSDANAKVSLGATAAASASKLLPIIDRFDFLMGREKALKHSADVIAKAVIDHAGKVIEPDASVMMRIMLCQSLYETATDIYSACWQKTARFVLRRSKECKEKGMDNDRIRAAIPSQIKSVDDQFRVQLNEVVKVCFDENPIIGQIKNVIMARSASPKNS